MNAHVSTADDGNPILHYSFKDGHYKIALRDILYFESRERKCIIHVKEANRPELCFYGKLSELSKALLPYGFIRCHQSFLVASTKNTCYKDNKLYIENLEIPVSERYRRAVIDLFDGGNSIFSKQDKGYSTGAMVCIKGEYLGSIIRIYPDVICTIGRDGEKSEIVINLPYVSRAHCDIVYRLDNTYEITDHSHNGTYRLYENGRSEKLKSQEGCILPSGSVICFGDRSLQYRLI